VELRNDLNGANNILIELGQLVSRNPEFLADRSADSLHFVASHEIGAHSKTSHISGATFLYIPISRNNRCVLLVQYGIEDRLVRETRRKFFPPDSSINSSSSGPTGRYSVVVSIDCYRLLFRRRSLDHDLPDSRLARDFAVEISLPVRFEDCLYPR